MRSAIFSRMLARVAGGVAAQAGAAAWAASSARSMSSASERPYGPARGSKYQGQDGPVTSRIDRDGI